jgi:hypothetical protein
VTLQQLNWTSGSMNGTGVTQMAAGAAIAITGDVRMSGRTLNNAGTLTLSGSGQMGLGSAAVLNNPAGSTIDFQNNGQFYNIGGAASTIINGGLLKKSAGTGTSSINSNVTLNNTGTIDIETGTLSLPSYSESATSKLTIVIGGTTPGTQFGRLVVSDAASFAGTLNVSLANGYVPNIADQFAIVQFGSKTGNFSATNGFNIGGAKQFSLIQNPTNFTLSVVAAP